MACGIPVENWRRWERDNRAPRDVVDQAKRISNRTGCDFYWLLVGSTGGATGKDEGLPFLKVGVSNRRPVVLRDPVAA